MNRTSRTIALALAALPLLPAVAAAKDGQVVVANISAMTGPTSGTHMMCQSGTRDYLDHLNKQGGISGKSGKVKVKFVAYDSQYVAAKAKDGFARLLEQDMAVWTQCASAHSDALVSDYESAKVPLVTGSQGIASLYSDWAYGNYHSGIANMIRTWILWRKAEWEKAGRPGGSLVLGTVTSDEPFVPLALWDIDAFAQQEGVKLVKETFPKGTTDAGPQLLRLKNEGAQQVYVIASASGAVVVLKSARALNLGIPMTQCAAATLGDVISLGGAELAEGYQGEYFFEPMSKAASLPDSAGMKLARELWSKNHGKESPNDMYVNGVISGMVIAQGIRNALESAPPDKIDGQAIKQGLDRISGFDAQGLTRPISYVKDDHIGPKQVRYWVVKNGRVEPVSDWMPTTTFRIPKK